MSEVENDASEGALQSVTLPSIHELAWGNHTNFIVAPKASMAYVRCYGLVVECLMQNKAFAAESSVDGDAVNYYVIGICICDTPVRRRAETGLSNIHRGIALPRSIGGQS